MAAPLAACSNPFLTSYQGLRCPPVNTAQIATQPPTDATLLGTSDFVTEVAVGDVEAIQAAERVGANIVQWDRAFLRKDVVLARDEVLGDSGGDAPMPVEPATAGDSATAVEGTWYRIHARFWRSNALGGFPAVASEPRRSSASTLRDDDTLVGAFFRPSDDRFND